MKWYKHISDSLDDPFIFELMSLFGSDGYLVFFGILEIYSREFSVENGWKLEVNLSYFHQKLRISSSKIKNILLKIHKWEIVFNDDQVTIYIPKFTTLLDEWTMRKLGSNSGQTPKILGTDKDKDKELDIDKDTNKVGISKKTKDYTPEFLSFWSSYPNKSGSKKAAFDIWVKMKKELPNIGIILSAVIIQKGWRKNANGEFRPEWKDAERWLKNRMWEAEVPSPTDQKNADVPKDDFRNCKECGQRNFKGDLNSSGICIKCEGKK
jgi:hypothetical protein